LVAKDTFPVNVPPAVGLKATVKVVVAPAATVVVPKVEPSVKPVPVTVIGAVKTRFEVPEFVMVKVAVEELPGLTDPKL
jgi:hypothetical protein